MSEAREIWTLAVDLEREHGDYAVSRLAEIVINAAKERDKDAIRLWQRVAHTFPALNSPAGYELRH
jgi:hypothetical protein